MAVVRIGDKQVVETGSFIVAGGPDNGTVALNGLLYTFRVLISQDPPFGRYAVEGASSGSFTFVGAITAPGYTWGFQSVGMIGGRLIDVIIRVKYLAHSAPNPPVFGIDYTFTYQNASASTPVNALAAPR